MEGAASALGISTSLLNDVESGAVELNMELQTLMERVYGIRLTQLVPKEPPAELAHTPISYDAAQGVLRVGTLGVRFRWGLDSNDVLLRGFSSALRRQRQVPPSMPLELRGIDLEILGSLLNLDDEALDERARFWFGQTAQTAQSFQGMLRLAKSVRQQNVS